jgi:Prophage CP4-57 regulatory protein (AlpA)
MSDTARVLAEALAKGVPISIGGDAEMMTLLATCAFFGGDKPINPSTLYRGIKKGFYPPPVHLGTRASRWRRSECLAALDKLRQPTMAQPAAQRAQAGSEGA